LTPDHYAVLGISETASPQEVKSAFRTLAREWHPDQLGPNATKAQRELTEEQMGRRRPAPPRATSPPPRQDQAPRPSFGSPSPSADGSGRGNLVAGGVFSVIWYFIFAEGLNGFAGWYNPLALMPVVIWPVVEIPRYRRGS